MVFIPLGVCATVTFVSVALSYCFKQLVRRRKRLRNAVLKGKRDSWRKRRHTFRKLKNLLKSRKTVNQRRKLSLHSTNTDSYNNIKKFYKNLILDDIQQQALEESTETPQQALEESTETPQQALEETTETPQQALEETTSPQTIKQMAKKRKFEEGSAKETLKKRRISENNQLEEEKRLFFDRKPPKMANKRSFLEGTTEKDAKKRRIDDALVKWLPQFGLSQEDKKILESQEYMDNKIIDAAQTLLKSQFKTEGLQSIVKSIRSFDPVHGKSVQFHFDPERMHCFVSCFRKNYVEIADSGSFAGLTQSGMKQIRECYKDVVQDPIKTMRFLKVDPQPNNYDCGVYAIAYAYELLSRTGNPTCKFRHIKMRKHLIRCLEKGRITAFPKIIRRGQITLNS